LPPIALDQSPEALAETPPSGASPLPHLDRGSRLDRSSPITRIKPTEAHQLRRPPCHCSNTSKNVGGGLPPIALDQSPEALAETPPSGASPLPHLDRGSRLDRSSPITRIKPTEAHQLRRPPCHCSNTSKNVGGGLPPIAAGQSPEALAETPPSGASPLPHLDRGT